MNVNENKKRMVFVRKNEYGTFYSIGLSKKDRNNKYINGYMPCQFRKGVVIDNKTEIYIKSAWIDFYIDKDNKTNTYLFINEFTTDSINTPASIENTPKTAKIDPYEAFANEVEITGKDLPF